MNNNYLSYLMEKLILTSIYKELVQDIAKLAMLFLVLFYFLLVKFIWSHTYQAISNIVTHAM